MRRLIPAAAAAAILLIGCSDSNKEAAKDVGQDAARAVVRNAAALGGAAAFSRNGVNVEGTLDCKADTPIDGGTAWKVTCTGKTEDGRSLEMKGDVPTDQQPSDAKLTGKFTGTVDGKQVFEATCLGTSC